VVRPVRLALASLALALAVSAPAGGQHPARHTTEQDVYDIASRLRCVVCQNLSVADSPSEMATQMRGVIRERLRGGETPAQVTRYFVDKYGEWILLEPRREGFTLLVWVLPPLAVAAGLALVAGLLLRWTRRRPAAAPSGPPADAALRERLRREMETGA
jgi:cytochrome c-type biogenesis protein CcmH